MMSHADKSPRRAKRAKGQRPALALASRSAVRWGEHQTMWVIGCIDSSGAITARPLRDHGTHGIAESNGRRWRFLVWSQDFHATIGGVNDILSAEEYITVCDWLIRHGYADDRILSNRTDQTAGENPATKGKR